MMSHSPSAADGTNGEYGQANNPVLDTDDNFLRPWTMNGCRGTRCWLLDSAREINIFLSAFGMELRPVSEMNYGTYIWHGIAFIPRRNSEDRPLVALARSPCGNAFGPWASEHRERAERLLRSLLLNHWCLRNVEIDLSVIQHSSLVTVLNKCRSLDSLTIYCTHGGLDVRKLEELRHFQGMPICLLDDWENKCRVEFENMGTQLDALFVALELQLEHLTALDVVELSMTKAQATRLVQALTTNSNVVDLAVGELVFACEEDNSGTLFASYLTSEYCGLKKLKLKSLKVCERDTIFSNLIPALCKIRTLEDLTVDVATKHAAFMRTTTLFACLVAKNSSLRRLQLPFASEFDDWPHLQDPTQPQDSNAAQCMDRWLTALRSPNIAVNELSIDLRGFGLNECRAFFKEVSQKKVLKLVVLPSVPPNIDAEALIRIIRNCWLSDRVAILNYDVDVASVDKLYEMTEEICSVTIKSGPFPQHSEHDPDPIISAFDTLIVCPHVKTIRVKCINSGNSTHLSSLAKYVSYQYPLAEVDVELGAFCALASNEVCQNSMTELVSALVSNKSLVRLSLWEALLSKSDMDLLVDAARRNQNLTNVIVTPHKSSSREQLNDLKIALSDIQESTARNRSLVKAVAEIVVGDRYDIQVAEAIIMMCHHNPQLLEAVRQRAGVTRTVARTMIDNTRRWINRMTS